MGASVDAGCRHWNPERPPGPASGAAATLTACVKTPKRHSGKAKQGSSGLSPFGKTRHIENQEVDCSTAFRDRECSFVVGSCSSKPRAELERSGHWTPPPA